MIEYDANEILNSLKSLTAAAYNVDEQIFNLEDDELQQRICEIHNIIRDFKHTVISRLDKLKNQP